VQNLPKLHALLIIKLGKGCPKLFRDVQRRIKNFQDIYKKNPKEEQSGHRRFSPEEENAGTGCY